MKIEAHPEWQSTIATHALNSVSSNDKRNSEGSEEVITNPDFDHQTDDEMTAMVEDILSRCDLTDQLRLIEDSNRAKLGPRSIAKPWGERRESLSAYFAHTDHDPGQLNINGSGTQRPLGLKAAGEKLIRSSSAGLPYMTRKGLVLDEAVSEFDSQVGEYPCILYTRTQEKGKTRNVWGYPIADTMWEQRFYSPYQRLEKQLRFRSALLGPDHVDAAITGMLHQKGNDDLVVSVDFSAYDASVKPEYAYEAFSAIGQSFQREYHREIYELYRRFVTIPIHTPEGDWSGPHGIPSGSSFTNTVDSLVQFMISGNYHRACQIQGDDGVYILPKSEYNDFLSRFKNAGLNVNEEKSETFETKECVYLQRYYHEKYRSRSGGLGGVYSLFRAISRIKYFERWTNLKKFKIEESDFYSLRTITILENCKHHPGFQELVKLAHSLDRNGLKFSQAGVAAYSRVLQSKARAGVLHGESLEKGLSSFETIKVLKTL